MMERDGSTLLIATSEGLVTAGRSSGTWKEVSSTLDGHRLTTVVSREGAILAAGPDGVFRSDDRGGTWHEACDGLTTSYVRWLAFHPDISDREFAGTEPAGIFVSHDGAGTWRACLEVAELRDRFGWFLPYSPEAGCVRGFAFHGNRVYAAIEVGGVLRSDDAGETWRLAGGSTGEPVFDIPPEHKVFADVHWVASHPSSPDSVFAATAKGLYRSSDGGDTWTVTHAGSYCRAVWVDAEDVNHLILGPAESVGKNGSIEESHDGGEHWVPATNGLDLPWPDRMVERFMQIEGELFAITNDGCLYATPLPGANWKRLLPVSGRISAVAPYCP